MGLSGLVKQVWMACTIVFILILPYVVLKRRLWFPGLVVVTWSSFGMAKLTPIKWGPLRVQHLLIMASILIIGIIMLERKRLPRRTRSNGLLSDHAPVFLVFLAILMLLRMLFEYANTGAIFFPREIRDLVFTTLLPCLIIIIHPGREDSFVQILQGIALGALFALLPAFLDIEALSNVWADLTSGLTVYFQRFGYRDRNTVAFFALQAAVSIFYLNILQMKNKKRHVYHFVAMSLVAFSMVNQSRRWFLGVITFVVLFYPLWLTGITSRAKMRGLAQDQHKPNLINGFVIGVLIFSVGSFLATRFDRFSFDTLSSELGPSFLVPATSSRADTWKSALDVWSDHPWSGVGLSGFGVVGLALDPESGEINARHIGAHSLLMDVLVQYGIVGVILASVFFLGMGRFFARWIRLQNNEKIAKEIKLLLVFWVALLPAAFFGSWAPHHLGLLALLPCTAWLIRNVSTGFITRSGNVV